MPVAHCPSDEILQRFLLGRVAEPEAGGLERHLDGCPRCRHAMATLPADDPLVAAARTAGPAARDPVAERLIAELSGLIPRSDDATAGFPAATPGPPDGTQELYDFLAPPAGPGELGRLGPYRVLSLLGAGGMGVVFRAEDVQLGRPVALKVIRPALAASAAPRRRFLREARAIAGLEHEHIVSILQVGEDRGVPYLAMPYLAGETLENRLRREDRLPVPELVRIGRQVADGLAAAHARGLVHRDVKPSNIWLEERDGGPTRVKLLDFGLVRAAGDEADLTHSGVIVGTPAYMAPEQAEGAPVDPRTDLFSLGCVLYRMCTGNAPFAASTTLKTLLVLARGRARPPREVNPLVPPALSDLILKLLARRPDDRPPSAAAVGAELAAIAAGRVGARPRRRRHIAAGLLVTGLALAAGVFGPGLFRREPRPDPDGSPPPEATAEALFGPEVRYPTGLYPSQVAVGDFDRDGKVDLAVANLHSHTVSILRGNGDGTFGPPQPFQADPWFASTVMAADLDGDGKLDLAVTAAGGSHVNVLRGNGDGTFAAPVPYAVGADAAAASVGDFNRDGRADLAVACRGGVSVLLGEPGGSFAPAVFHPAGAGAYGAAVADLDGDGTLDLAVAVTDGGAVSVLLGNGDGTFREARGYGAAPAGAKFVPLAGDVNGDGRPDLVVRDRQGASLFLGRGDGTFGEARLLAPDAVPVALADFDRDGKPDVILAQDAAGLVLCLGTGDGTFRDGGPYGGDRPNGHSLATGDFNGDGAADLVVPNGQRNDIAVRLNRTAARRRHLGPAAFFPCGKGPLAVAVGDFTGDGVPDVAAANGGDDTVTVLPGRGGRTFGPPAAYPAGKRPRSLAVGDLNRDGRPDLVVACEGDQAVRVLFGRRDGMFTAGEAHAVGKAPASVTLADLDRDGRLDAVTADHEGGTVTVLRGRGDGTFLPAVSQAVAAHPFFVTAADLDRDGRPDLVVAHRDQVGQVTVLLGRGDGTFLAPVVLPAGSYPQSVAVADFNRDGRLDLAVGNWAQGDVNLYLGNGDGTFRNPVNHFLAGQAYALVAADFDLDGRADLAVSDPVGNRATLEHGNGDGTFSPPDAGSGVGLQPAGLATADLDGDGRPELVVANARSDTVAVLPNVPAGPTFRVSTAIGSKTVAGTPFKVLIQAIAMDNTPDRGFTGTVRFRGTDPEAGLPAGYAFTAADQGVHSFDLTLTARGEQIVTVEDAAGALRPAGLTMGVLGLADLVFRVDTPAEVPAGRPFTLTVNVMERGSSWVSGYPGTVRFTSSDPAAALPPDYRFPGDQSLHPFISGLTLRTPGVQTITVTDPAYPALTGSAKVQVKATDK